ncbi:flippase [Pontibacter litorisediminis]|uniref:flippase n=1 Tax=Pontibacter litorisediminis TaxID=1846260 RepID=UPI0023EB20E9|nr:flippase [Pontibacter litorisediminis]
MKDQHEGKSFKKYAFNTGWLFAEQLFRIISSLLVGVWVARYLGPEQYGVYSYAVAFVALFAAIAHLGLQGIVVRELINGTDQQRVLGTAFWMQVVGGIVVIALMGSVLPFTSNDARTNLYIMIIAAGLLFQSFQVIDYYFQSIVESKYVSACRLTQLFISSAAKIILITAEADLIYFVLITFLDQITLAAALAYAYKLKHPQSPFYRCFRRARAKSLFAESWPMIVSGLVVMVYMKIDQVMIKELLGANAVGVYSAAVRLAEAWYFVPIIISQSLFPAIISAKSQGEQLYRLRLQRLLNLMMVLSVLVAVTVTFTSDFLVAILFGSAYAGAGAVLSIQVWAGIFVASGLVSSKWFIMEKLQRYLMYRSTAGAILNIALNLILIPSYGIIGSAVATLVSQFVAAIFLNAFFSNTRAMFILQLRSILGFGLLGNQLKDS